MAAKDLGLDPRARRAAIAFNEAINERDLAALEGLMTDGHTFIDSDDSVFSGREVVLDAWKGFFAAFPDYRNEWWELMPADDGAIAIGRSVCSNEPALDGPAIWKVRTADDDVAEWRVYEDTPENRRTLGIPATDGVDRAT